MMNEDKKNRIARFLIDEVTADLVRRELLDSFMKPKDLSDIHTLAASRMAIDFLDAAWKDLSKYKNVVRDETKKRGQIGV